MPNFTNTKDLAKYIGSILHNNVVNEVLKEIIDIEQTVIQEEVYNVYTPKKYQRRYGNGGFIDEKNIVIGEIQRLSSGFRLRVVNNTPTKGKSAYRLDEIIEKGIGRGYGKPRPYNAKTQQVVDHTKVARKVLAKYFNLK